jgi:RNA polymerase sigma factor (sigma-70 family)
MADGPFFRAGSGLTVEPGERSIKAFNRYLDAVDEFDRMVRAQGDRVVKPGELDRLRREAFAKHDALQFVRLPDWQQRHDFDRIVDEYWPRHWKAKLTGTVKGAASEFRLSSPRSMSPEDTVAAGLLGLWRAWYTFNPRNEERASFQTYAQRCMRNAMLDYLKRAQRDVIMRRAASLDAPLGSNDGGDKEMTLADVIPTPQDQVPLVVILRSAVMALQANLSKFEQQVMTLTLLGYYPSEIAAQLGVTVRSVYDASRRVRDKAETILA